MRGDGGIAGEGQVVDAPKFHSWGKCTLPLLNINSDWMSNASSGLCIILVLIIRVLYFASLGETYRPLLHAVILMLTRILWRESNFLSTIST